MTHAIINPHELGTPRGWSHGVLGPPGGRILFVAGQDATDEAGEVPSGFVAQFARALAKSLAVVREAGGKPEDVARITVFVTDLAAYRSSLRALGEAWRGLMGKHYPAMALVEVKGLVHPNAVVELETTAVLPGEKG
jgi:enamine deaminase RidA (YjgF/YER057c/UK114 family)